MVSVCNVLKISMCSRVCTRKCARQQEAFRFLISLDFYSYIIGRR